MTNSELVALLQEYDVDIPVELMAITRDQHGHTAYFVELTGTVEVTAFRNGLSVPTRIVIAAVSKQDLKPVIRMNSG